MQKKKSIFVISAITIIFCIIMALVDGVIQANYFVKSGFKLVLFLVFPALYTLIDKDLQIKSLFQIKKKGLKFTFALAITVYVVILGGYILLKGVFDFSKITKSLTENIGVHSENFIYVSLYISFINSLLEEFFFRGFAFLTLRKIATRRFAYLFSALAFAIYHIAMMIGWFSVEVFIIVLAGLFLGGLIFNYLNEKSGNIYPSWLVHMFANFAINTIGFMLFGVIPTI